MYGRRTPRGVAWRAAAAGAAPRDPAVVGGSRCWRLCRRAAPEGWPPSHAAADALHSPADAPSRCCCAFVSPTTQADRHAEPPRVGRGRGGQRHPRRTPARPGPAPWALAAIGVDGDTAACCSSACLGRCAKASRRRTLQGYFPWRRVRQFCMGHVVGVSRMNARMHRVEHIGSIYL